MSNVRKIKATAIISLQVEGVIEVEEQEYSDWLDGQPDSEVSMQQFLEAGDIPDVIADIAHAAGMWYAGAEWAGEELTGVEFLDGDE